MTKIETVKKANAILEKRIHKFPEFAIYRSVEKQLAYLLNVLNGQEKDLTKLDKIIVGLYAVREFEESDPELSDVLIDCQNIANEMIS